ncbi:MAG: hypothetical protein JXR37_17475 [Kiritimatiellae bacterium]|nr:hypothetical protein [Kiritimatiellia bacterium]
MSMEDLKRKIAERRPAFGVVLRNAEPALAELVGLTGFDFAWIDMEHSTLTAQQVDTLILALKHRGGVPLVRVRENNSRQIGQVLDLGADIVNVPHVDTAAEAERAVQAAKYYPLGRRGYSSSSRSAAQGLEKLTSETMQRTNDQTMLMVQIESRTGLDNLPAIAGLDGIDALFLGLGDLSQDLGMPGRFEEPAIKQALDAFAGTVREAGKISATAVSEPAAIRQCVQLGIQIVSCAVDVVLFKDALQRLMEAIRD